MPVRLPQLLLFPLLLALAVPLQGGEAAAVPASAAPRPLVAVLSDQDYADSAKRILAGCDRARLLATTEPEAGMVITMVQSGSQGEKLGIAPGDMLTALEGAPIPTGFALNNHRTSQPQQLTIRSPSGEERTVTIMPGKLGISFRDLVWRPELTYLRRPGRPAAADDDMLVACLSGATETDLRETALAHVAAAGGQPPLWLSLAAWVALARGRCDDAIAYGTQALEHDTDWSAGWRVGRLIFTAAIAGDRLAAARAIMPKLVASPCGNMNSEAVSAMLDARLTAPGAAPAGRMPAAKAPAKTPAKALAASPEGLERRAEALSELAGHMLAGDDAGGLEAVRSLGSGRTLTFAATDGTTHFIPLGPYGRNCSFKGVLTYQVQASGPGQPAPLVSIGIFDATQAAKFQSLCSINPLEQGAYIVQEGLPPITLPCATRIGPDCATSLRISVLDDRTEMAVNGITIFQGAVAGSPARRLGLFLFARGVTGTLEGMSWRIDEASSREAPLPPRHVPAGGEKPPTRDP